MTALPPLTDVLGWAAAALTLLAFSCNDLLRLRYVALTANAAFIAYGLTAQLWPVLALHWCPSTPGGCGRHCAASANSKGSGRRRPALEARLERQVRAVRLLLVRYSCTRANSGRLAR